MSQSTNSSCPTGVPDNLPIPQNVTYAVIPGQNTSDPWMVRCCQPNPVQIVNGCWEWCYIPATMSNDTTSSAIEFDFDNCLQLNGRNLNQSNGLLIHMSSSGASNRGITVARLALLLLSALHVLM